MYDKYYWVVGGGLLQIPLIEEVRKFEFGVIVSDLNKKCVCYDEADIFVHKDIFDLEGHIEEVKRLTSEGKNIVGVLAAGIDAPETMAIVAQTLGLPAVDPNIAFLVHNKHLFREKLETLGYPVPKYRTITKESIDQLSQVIDEIGFPLIVKNTDSSGSRGTKIFYEEDFTGMQKMIQEAIKVSKSAVALIEECWDGPEQTVETIFDIEGNFHPCFITDRIFDRSNGYPIELGLRNPSSLPYSVQQEMFSIAENVSRDLGIDKGAAKFDMILTKDGPRIIEMTVRLSGGFDCQYLVPAATGKNVLRAAIITSLGDKFSPELLKNTKNRVALSESIWPEPGEIKKIEGMDRAKKMKGVEHIFFRYNVGDVIEPYTDCTKRVCFIIVTGSDEEEAKNTILELKRTIKIDTE